MTILTQASRLGGSVGSDEPPLKFLMPYSLINKVMTVCPRSPSGSHTWLNKHANPLDEHSPLQLVEEQRHCKCLCFFEGIK